MTPGGKEGSRRGDGEGQNVLKCWMREVASSEKVSFVARTIRRGGRPGKKKKNRGCVEGSRVSPGSANGHQRSVSLWL